MTSFRAALALIGSVALFGCASSAQPILYGDKHYPALPPDAPVQVFVKETDIEGPHKVIGAISAMDLGKWQILTRQDALPSLKAKARSIGANAIIVDDYQAVKSGLISTGYSVQARAVRLGTD